MEKHIQKLELAKAYFYSWRMPEAYSIFRRFFDRMPFEFDAAHAQYIAIYVRLLAELGKEREMVFYRNIVEKLFHKKPDPNIAYALVVLDLYSEPKDPERAKSLLDSCLAQSISADLAIKAKMLLASYYSTYRDDIAACEAIISSIAEPSDLHLRRMLVIWQANLLRLRGDLVGAQRLLDSLVEGIRWEEDWYTVFSAQVIKGILHIQCGQLAEAQALLITLRERTQNQKLKCVARQLRALEEKLESVGTLEKYSITDLRGHFLFRYGNKSVRVKSQTAGGKLLSLLVSKQQVSKEDIIQRIYSRRYAGPEDDALVYYQIHSLRRQLGETGLPPEAIETAKGTYTWRPEIENEKDLVA